jgi:hypothetical protein
MRADVRGADPAGARGAGQAVRALEAGGPIRVSGPHVTASLEEPTASVRAAPPAGRALDPNQAASEFAGR